MWNVSPFSVLSSRATTAKSVRERLIRVPTADAHTSCKSPTIFHDNATMRQVWKADVRRIVAYHIRWYRAGEVQELQIRART